VKIVSHVSSTLGSIQVLTIGAGDRGLRKSIEQATADRYPNVLKQPEPTGRESVSGSAKKRLAPYLSSVNVLAI
jgi:hypothetical protein